MINWNDPSLYDFTKGYQACTDKYVRLYKEFMYNPRQ